MRFSSFLHNWVAFFCMFFIATFSYPYYFLPDWGKYTHPLFEKMAQWIAQHILHLTQPYTIELISDATGLYIHTAVLIVLSLIFAAIYRLFQNPYQSQFQGFYTTTIRYYLALQLLIYGASKIFKWQFYLPEPNTLYTPVGQLPKDLLFWTTMGMSYSYTVFSGIVEIIPAILLLFRRTYLLGALIAFAVMTNVLMLNISFDISVKIYATFLLGLSAVLILPFLSKVYQFLVLQKSVQLENKAVINFSPLLLYPLKMLVLGLFVYETIGFYWNTSNFNDDNAPRPPFHGAYQVTEFIKNRDTLTTCLSDSSRWKNVFIHRQGYFITQNEKDEFQDYGWFYDSTQLVFELTKYDDSSIEPIYLYYERLQDSVLTLSGYIRKDTIFATLKQQDYKKMPLFQHHFHWTIDE